MSYDKQSYSLRKHHDDCAVAKQVKIWLTYNDRASLTEKRVGKMRKHNSLNCGVSKCAYCVNPRRRFGWITFKETVANERYKQMRENYEEWDGIFGTRENTVGFGSSIGFGESIGVGEGISGVEAGDERPDI